MTLYKYFQCLLAIALIGILLGCQDQRSLPVEKETAHSEKIDVSNQKHKEPTYNHLWHKSDFWAGEYPNGLVILEQGVILQARVKMDPAIQPSVKCPVDYRGVYHPWNKIRVESESLKFITMTKVLSLNVTEHFDYSYKTEFDGDLKSISYHLGDSIEYLGYLSEGFGQIDIGGQPIEIPISTLHEMTDLYPQDPLSHSWIELDCKGTTGFILISDLEGRKDVVIGNDGIDEYGVAFDLTEDQSKPVTTSEALKDDYYICFTQDDVKDNQIWIRFLANGHAKQIKYSNQNQVIELRFLKMDIRQGAAYPTTKSYYEEIKNGKMTGEYILTQSGNWEYVEYREKGVSQVYSFTIERDANTYGDTPCF